PKATQPAAKAKRDPNPPYAGFNLGYNRSVIANRVHDLLTAFGVAQTLSGDGSVRVIGLGDRGPIALLACAVASHHVPRAAIDLNQFDFDQITTDTEPMLLPGGLKYGGIYSFVRLCSGGETMIWHARRTGRFEQAAKVAGVTLKEDEPDANAMIEWLLR